MGNLNGTHKIIIISRNSEYLLNCNIAYSLFDFIININQIGYNGLHFQINLELSNERNRRSVEVI